jgi:hypothetical protein
LCALICDARSPLELVERELLYELCPRIGRRFELLDELLAIGIVVQHAKLMRANKLVKVLLRLFDIRKNDIVGCENDFFGRRGVDIRRWVSEVDFFASRDPNMNSFMRRVGVPSIQECSPRNPERPLSQTITAA